MNLSKVNLSVAIMTAMDDIEMTVKNRLDWVSYDPNYVLKRSGNRVVLIDVETDNKVGDYEFLTDLDAIRARAQLELKIFDSVSL